MLKITGLGENPAACGSVFHPFRPFNQLTGFYESTRTHKTDFIYSHLMLAYKTEGLMNSWVTAKLIPRVEKREELAICTEKSTASD